jgi:AcrR family transcriptional regulator
MNRPVRDTHHRRNLKRALLDEALKVIDEEGPESCNMRTLGHRIGVSHEAPFYHFSDKTALLTSLAAEGYTLLHESLAKAAPEGPFAVGMAYVRFALEHSAYIKLMFQPSWYRADDHDVEVARAMVSSVVLGTDPLIAPGRGGLINLASWCLMHGLATLWLNGNLRIPDKDPVELARMLGALTLQLPPSYLWNAPDLPTSGDDEFDVGLLYS